MDIFHCWWLSRARGKRGERSLSKKIRWSWNYFTALSENSFSFFSLFVFHFVQLWILTKLKGGPKIFSEVFPCPLKEGFPESHRNNLLLSALLCNSGYFTFFTKVTLLKSKDQELVIYIIDSKTHVKKWSASSGTYLSYNLLYYRTFFGGTLFTDKENVLDSDQGGRSWVSGNDVPWYAIWLQSLLNCR